MTLLASLPLLARLPQPGERARRWLHGLFGSRLNIAITLVYLGAVFWLIVPFLRWAFWDATFIGTRETCLAAQGACWAFIHDKLNFIFFGFYPQEELWRPRLVSALLIVLVAATAWPRLWGKGLLLLWLVAITASLTLMGGKGSGQSIDTEKWGGLPATLLLSILSFVCAFPLAILLALGRRSRMGGVRLLSTLYIELMRGVPFIAVLYSITLLLPLMLPSGAGIDKFLRAGFGVTAFFAAYLAETIRGGLQAIPGGQYEAARSLGLGYWRMMGLVVLPQALRVVIPAIVNLAIGLFQDTTLVIVIGMFDFLNTSRTAPADPAWLGFYNEAYVVAALVYFAACFSASRYSLWLEGYFGRSARR